MPKISVIIPVYNAENYLEKCLDSIVNQTLEDLEIICVDDGSTDGSLEILKKYAAKDNRIILLTQKNQHAGVARNNGLKIANGEFVHFLDSDDWLVLDAYEKMYEIIKNSEADLVKFKAYSYDSETNEIAVKTYRDFAWIDKKYFDNDLSIEKDPEILAGLPDAPWRGIYSTKFLRDNNIYFDDFMCANDVGFFYRCIINARKVYFSSKRFVYHRINLKDSLIAKRAENFDCQTALYKVVKEASKDLPLNLQKILINRIILVTFNWYKRCLKEYNLSTQAQYKLKKEMKIFLKQISKENLNDNNLQVYKELIKQGQKEFLQNILSIKNDNIYNVLCILGLKLKIKSKKLKKKLEESEREKERKAIADLKEQLKNAKIEYEYKLYKYMAPEKYPQFLHDWYKFKTGETLNLDNPQTFNEKIQWLKLYDSTPIKTRLADKYLVREWVKEKIGEEYLIPLLGVWDKFDEIDFDNLPDKFVLKCNHGCGYNIIVTDKAKLDFEDARNKINTWMNEDFTFKNGLELHYSAIPRKIIAEEYIADSNGEVCDYKLLCFSGEVKYIWVDKDRYKDHRRNLYDINWNLLDKRINSKYKNFDFCPKPKNFEKMKQFAQEMSKDFCLVRVDFYEQNDKLYFGEMTFTTTSGTGAFYPKEFNYELGQMIKLPIKDTSLTHV